jgi:hypothetical protein
MMMSRHSNADSALQWNIDAEETLREYQFEEPRNITLAGPADSFFSLIPDYGDNTDPYGWVFELTMGEGAARDYLALTIAPFRGGVSRREFDRRYNRLYNLVMDTAGEDLFALLLAGLRHRELFKLTRPGRLPDIYLGMRRETSPFHGTEWEDMPGAFQDLSPEWVDSE